MKWTSKQGRRRLAAAMILVVGLVVTAEATRQTIATRDAGASEWLAERGEVVAGASNDTVMLAIEGVSAVAALFENTESVSNEQFDGFVRSLDPSIWLLGVAYLPIVPRADLDAHEASLRVTRRGYRVSGFGPDGPVPVERDRDIYYPVTQLLAGPLLSAGLADGQRATTEGLIDVGYDAGLRQEWLPALEYAVATGAPAVSEFLEIVSPTGERFGQAFVVSVPVRDEVGNVIGLVAAPMLDVLLAAGGDTSLAADIDWAIENSAGLAEVAGTSSWSTTLRFPGTSWTLSAMPAEGSGFSGAVPWWLVAGVGTSITVLVAALYLVIGQRARTRDQIEEMRRFDRAKNQFLASVSHEVKTPLTVVVGVARELGERREDFSDEELGELLSLIVSQGDEVSAIIEDLLVAARADIGDVTLSPTRVDLRAQVESIARASTTGMTVTGVAGVAWADERRVRQIVRNLVTNAGRYGGPAIEIRLGSDVDRAWIEVADSGSPISPSEQDQMFDAYVSGHVEGDAAIGAMGLGLYISRHLARASRGDLTYHHDGEFSVFRLVLPTPGAQVDAPAQAERSPRRPSSDTTPRARHGGLAGESGLQVAEGAEPHDGPIDQYAVGGGV